MGASSDSSTVARLIKLGCLVGFVVVGFTSLFRYIFVAKDRNRCSSLLNDGWWIDDTYKSWQPASCMMHNYKAPEISSCLGHSRIVYVGDSIVRQQFFAALNLVKPGIDTSGEAHVNRKYVFNEQHLTLEFWWDPYLNETTDLLQGKLPSIRPSLMVVGSGAWQMHYLGDSYFKEWKKRIDTIFNAVQQTQVADAVLLSPVEIPQYEKLGANRTQTMTMDKITQMNDYLLERQSQMQAPQTPLEIPFVWNDIGTHATNVTEDGLHYNPIVTTVQTQIALNYRCNDQLDKKFPMSDTCCFTYPAPRWYQLAFMAFFLFWIPAGFLVKNLASDTFTLSKLFPSKKLLHACFVFGLCVMYMFYGDRTQLFGKIQKNFNATVFIGMMMAVAVLGMVKLQHKKEGDQGFLNRHQTDEWKGWMQVIILVYHFCGASGTSGIYNAVRILVAAYLFQTGYGHFFFFYKKADFGMGRILNVMVRLNFLTFVLQYLMDTDYLSYYFTPLVSFWFLVIWLVMYIGHQWNKVPAFMLIKLAVSCVATTAFIKIGGVLEFVFSLLEIVFNVHWNAGEWRFRLALDAYIVYIGMLCAYAFIKMTEHKVMDHPRFPMLKKGSLVFSVLAMVWYFWYEITRESKFVYNGTHPYISWIPIMAFIFLRNANVYLRNTHSEFYAFIGKISLETFIGQFHMWLAGDTKGLLVILAHPTWVAGLGWWINLLVSSCLFIFVCHYMSQTTHTISVAICTMAQPKKTDTTATTARAAGGDYQAVPLLPTSTSEVHTSSTGIDPVVQPTHLKQGAAILQAQEEQEDEEVWDASLVDEKKPNLFRRILDDTRVKVLLFFIVIGLLNNLC
ncbi:hypothetical protein HMPREF1544_05695 [Mucor circinelloides 1006PhL]|uniref:Cas1p 10 TM acyl transferase domain-containing protein n=1 Tax=Mucor circinelloides f. circinelloides (strain 1006PhL) TaxID=1220926 RepID=S2JBD6_MUCC1|nr:hypothetical protein HMPREF1544_05695 [Mucor circinelloides 1006PhL]